MPRAHGAPIGPVSEAWRDNCSAGGPPSQSVRVPGRRRRTALPASCEGGDQRQRDGCDATGRGTSAASVLLLGVADVASGKRFYADRGLAVAKSYGRKYVEFVASA